MRITWAIDPYEDRRRTSLRRLRVFSKIRELRKMDSAGFEPAPWWKWTFCTSPLNHSGTDFFWFFLSKEVGITRPELRVTGIQAHIRIPREKAHLECHLRFWWKSVIFEKIAKYPKNSRDLRFCVGKWGFVWEKVTNLSTSYLQQEWGLQTNKPCIR